MCLVNCSSAPSEANRCFPCCSSKEMENTMIAEMTCNSSEAPEVTGQSPSLPMANEVLTVGEVAQLARLDRNTVYKCIRRGELAVCRCGRIIRLHRQDVLDWLRGNTRVTRSSRRKSS